MYLVLKTICWTSLKSTWIDHTYYREVPFKSGDLCDKVEMIHTGVGGVHTLRIGIPAWVVGQGGAPSNFPVRGVKFGKKYCWFGQE